MRNDLERSWDAADAYWALHPQESEEASQWSDASILEAVIACVLATLCALMLMATVAFGTIWFEASDCGDHATWMDGGCP